MKPLSPSEPLDPQACSGVLVFAEQRGGKLGTIALEMIGAGRRLADALGAGLSIAVLGAGVDSVVERVRGAGPDAVYVCDHAALADFQDEPYAAALEAIVRRAKPEILLVGATTLGRSFAPAVAARLDAGLVAGCTDLAIDADSKLLVATRPAFGATVFADVLQEKCRPQIATVRPRTQDPAVATGAPSCEVTAVALPDAAVSPRTKFLETVEEAGGVVDLTGAEVIVSGGRGIGGPEAFAMIEELADAMGGAVGASRAAVDAGWIPYSHQVGQTGRQVKPRIYVACGISGAVQHLVGMRTSDTIIAVNRDPEAPIFKVATYGLIGDVKDIVPALARRFRETG